MPYVKINHYVSKKEKIKSNNSASRMKHLSAEASVETLMYICELNIISNF